MQPPFNSFAHQTHSDSSTSTLPQQVFRPNMLQNSVPMQPQMGIMNPQIPFPLNNSNMPPTPLIPQANFMNASNPFLFAQNNHLGLPQLIPLQGNFGNVPQNATQGQIFGPNFSNLPQQLHQNLCLQNINHLLSMQMMNPGIFGIPQFGLVNQNQQNFVQPMKDVPGTSCLPLKSCSSEPQQGQGPNSQPSAFMRSQKKFVQNGQGSISNSNWKNVPGKNPTRELSQGFQKSHFHQMNNAKRKFGFHNDQRAKGRGNAKAMKFGQANYTNQPQEKKRKTLMKLAPDGDSLRSEACTGNECVKESLALTYTEQEIKQWCEERRKNYPTKANINKKLTEKLSNSAVIDKEVKMRREQLKDILAKQAELGVEVAEIPSYYLSVSDKQVRGRVENTRPLNKRGRFQNRGGRFQNRHDKRGRCNRKDQFAKDQKLADKNSSSTLSFSKKKPTLLQKLLSADIKRDKSHLLQAFRFMAMNSFFKDWPEKSLKFPSVMVKEGGVAGEVAGEVAEDKSLFSGNGVSEGRSSRMGEHFDHDKNNGDDKNMERKSLNIPDFEDDEQMNSYYVGGKGDIGVMPEEEEEGEIID